MRRPLQNLLVMNGILAFCCIFGLGLASLFGVKGVLFAGILVFACTLWPDSRNPGEADVETGIGFYRGCTVLYVWQRHSYSPLVWSVDSTYKLMSPCFIVPAHKVMLPGPEDIEEVKRVAEVIERHYPRLLSQGRPNGKTK